MYILIKISNCGAESPNFILTGNLRWWRKKVGDVEGGRGHNKGGTHASGKESFQPSQD